MTVVPAPRGYKDADRWPVGTYLINTYNGRLGFEIAQVAVYCEPPQALFTMDDNGIRGLGEYEKPDTTGQHRAWRDGWESEFAVLPGDSAARVTAHILVTAREILPDDVAQSLVNELLGLCDKCHKPDKEAGDATYG